MGTRSDRLRAALVVVALVGSGAIAIPATPAAATVSSPTQPVAVPQAADLLRSGWVGEEPGLQPADAAATDFGQVFDASVIGQVYAQPVVDGSTLVVATEANHAYGLDAAVGTRLWDRDLGVAWSATDLSCGDLAPTVGVTGTPVLDPATHTAYFASKTYAQGTSGPARWWVHGLDTANGAERAGFPVEVAGSASNDPGAVFDPTHEMQRPGLLLMGGVVYAAFGGHCDRAPYRGWVVGVRAADGALATLWTDEARAPDASPGAGIWQAGGALVSDGPGQVLLTTGNGDVPGSPTPGASPPGQLGESVVRLQVQPDGSLAAGDFFAPYDAQRLNGWDSDLGSGAPMGLPDGMGTAAHPHLMVQIGKQGYVYLLDRDHLGGLGQGANGQDDVLQRLRPAEGGGLWGKPSAWPGDGGYVYVVASSGGSSAAGSGGYLYTYRVGADAAGLPALAQVARSPDVFGFSSSAPVVTSDGTTSGSAVVWVVWSANGIGSDAQLRAYGALPVDGALPLLGTWPLGRSAKFAVPLAAGNRIFVGTRDGHVRSFGRPVSYPLAGRAQQFPRTSVGQQAQQLVTLTATEAIRVESLTATGTAFSAVPQGDLPRDLAPGDTLDVTATFQPAATGAAAGSLRLSTSLGERAVPLSGQGRSAAADPLVSPHTISFGGAPVGGSPLQQSLEVRNDGGAPMTISAVESPMAPFAIAGAPAPGTVLAPDASVTITVSFDPAQPGSSESVLTMRTDAGDLTVPMSGSATTPGHLTVDTSSVDAGRVVLGDSATVRFTVTNTGGTAVTITKSKPPAGPTAAASTTLAEGTVLAAGQAITEQVALRPSAAGPMIATWVVTGDDDSGEHDIELRGLGVQPSSVPPLSDTGWHVLGDARRTTGGVVSLTSAAAQSRGLALWPQPQDSADLRISFDSAIAPGATEGVALALLDSSYPIPAAPGESGAGLGLAGLPGAAVVLDTNRQGGEPAATFLGVTPSTASAPMPYAVTSHLGLPELFGTHHVEVRRAAGQLSVRVDGILRLQTTVALPAHVRVGLASATGALPASGAVGAQAVSNVVVTNAAAPAIVAVQAQAVTSPGDPAAKVALHLSGSCPAAGSWSLAFGASTVVSTAGATPDTSCRVRVASLGSDWTATVAVDGAPPHPIPIASGAVDLPAFQLRPGVVRVVIRAVHVLSPALMPGPSVARAWQLNGTARLSRDGGVTLTPVRPHVTGSVVLRLPVRAQGIRIDAVLHSTGGTAGAGTAVLLLPVTASAHSIGGGDSGLGAARLPGLAVTLATGPTPSTSVVGLVSGWSSAGKPTYLATSTAAGNLRGGDRSIRITYTGRRLAILVQSRLVLAQQVDLPPALLIGFSAATSTKTDEHRVFAIAVRGEGVLPALDSPAWSTGGAAVRTAGGVTLTSAAAFQRGSVEYAVPVPTAALRVAFTYNASAGGGADGVALCLLSPATTPGAVGSSGAGLGFAGLAGLAVVLHTYRGPTSPSDNYVGTSAGAVQGGGLVYTATSKAAPYLRGTHRVEVDLLGGRLTVLVDGYSVLDTHVSAPTSALVGLTGSTGGLTDAHSVSDVSVTVG